MTKTAGSLGCVVVATAEIRGFQKLRAFLMPSFLLLSPLVMHAAFVQQLNFKK